MMHIGEMKVDGLSDGFHRPAIVERLNACLSQRTRDQVSLPRLDVRRRRSPHAQIALHD